jgi:DNA-binding GntR family transcriptional regulator
MGFFYEGFKVFNDWYDGVSVFWNGIVDFIRPIKNSAFEIIQIIKTKLLFQALAQLAFDGYIIKHQGKGSVVKKLPKGIGILSLQGTTSSIGQENLKTHLVSKPRIGVWPELFMFDLSEIEIESGCIILERQRIVEKKPLLYEISYLPNINIPRFIQKSFENKSLFDVLRTEYHIHVIGGEQQIRAIKADSIIGKYLEINEEDPVLHLQRIMETNRIGFRYFSSIYCNTENSFLNGSF